jgi:alkanesulfonate monooxygenase SsuD/methylene tetrahydromethanopterin reductase-like flavin-dependent oxidoreductase (luciferase family)
MDTFPAIGAQGFDLFAAVRTGTLSELAPNLVAYRSAYAEAGHKGKGGVFLRVPVYVAETFDKAAEDCRDSIMGFYRQLGEQLERSASEAGARAIEQRDVRGRRLQETTFDEVLREKVIVGTPEMVTERLGLIASELQLDGILAELNCGGQVPREGVINCLRLLCSEVMPAFT